MMMMTPAFDFLRLGIATRATLNVPVRFTFITISHASGSVTSTGTVGPGMPPLFTNTSIPPTASAGAGRLFVQFHRVWIVCKPPQLNRDFFGSAFKRVDVDVTNADFSAAPSRMLALFLFRSRKLQLPPVHAVPYLSLP